MRPEPSGPPRALQLPPSLELVLPPLPRDAKINRARWASPFAHHESRHFCQRPSSTTALYRPASLSGRRATHVTDTT